MRKLAVVLVITTILLFGCVQHQTIHVLAGKGLKKELVAKAEEFSKKEGIVVNLTFTSYTKMKNFESYDIVIAPKSYPLYNLSLNVEAKKVIPYKARVPVIVVRSNSTIKSIEDLNGKTIVLINQTKFHVPGGCVGIKVVKALGIKANVTFDSPQKIFEDVLSGKADATIVWNDTVSVKNVRIIPIEKFRMEIYIFVIKDSDAVEKFVRYLTGGLNHVRYGC